MLNSNFRILFNLSGSISICMRIYSFCMSETYSSLILRVILFAAPSLHFAFACLRKTLLLFYAIFTCILSWKQTGAFVSLSLFPITLVEKKIITFFCIFISMFDRWNSTGSGTISIKFYTKYRKKMNLPWKCAHLISIHSIRAYAVQFRFSSIM